MTYFENAHPYIEALFHAMLAEQESWKLIESTLPTFYPDIQKLYPLEDDTDRAYILKLYNKVIVAISGTKSKKGWARNFMCWPDDGWHYGFKRSFKNFLCEPLLFALKGFKGKILITGHSAGPAIGLNADYYIRKVLQRDCELIGFCAPQAVNRKGRDQCRKAKVCATFLDIGYRDQVDNVAKLVGGKDYGYHVDLPDVGDPDINKIELIDDFFFGHAPSYVCKSVKQLFQNWKNPQDKFIDDISQYAIR